jgi:hypothetical protein
MSESQKQLELLFKTDLGTLKGTRQELALKKKSPQIEEEHSCIKSNSN